MNPLLLAATNMLLADSDDDERANRLQVITVLFTIAQAESVNNSQLQSSIGAYYHLIMCGESVHRPTSKPYLR